jgi:anti-sigma regulatory factor (Ser/Thr protein kinase)
MVTQLREAGCPAEAVDDLMLIQAELVGNAIRHARTQYTVTVTTNDDVVRIEVFDRDTRPPALMGLDADSTSGRGLNIVAAVAAHWGWQSDEDDDDVTGKTVWAELPIPPGRQTPAAGVERRDV